MKPFVHVLVLTAAALGAGACRSSPSDGAARDVARGSLMHRELKSYHLVYSEHRGPVGYLKVYDVAEAGGATYTWKFVYDAEYNELGWIDQMGTAYQYKHYPPGAMPNPLEPLTVLHLPADSIERNTMRMLGIDPALDNVSFPLAKEGDVGTAK